MASSNSEARKRACESQPMFVLREAERLAQRGRVRDALAALYDGAGDLEADALVDQLADRGLEVVER